MLVTGGTKYASNDWNFKNSFKVIVLGRKGCQKVILNFSVMISPSDKIAGIFVSHFDWYRKHIWSTPIFSVLVYSILNCLEGSCEKLLFLFNADIRPCIYILRKRFHQKLLINSHNAFFYNDLNPIFNCKLIIFKKLL